MGDGGSGSGSEGWGVFVSLFLFSTKTQAENSESAMCTIPAVHDSTTDQLPVGESRERERGRERERERRTERKRALLRRQVENSAANCLLWLRQGLLLNTLAATQELGPPLPASVNTKSRDNTVSAVWPTAPSSWFGGERRAVCCCLRLLFAFFSPLIFFVF